MQPMPLSPRGQSAVVNSVCERYRRAKKNLALYREGYLNHVEGDSEETKLTRLKEDQNYVNYVNRIYLLLSNESRFIIRNEFILKRDFFWWEKMYSRSTYYRHRSRALKEFIYYYEV